MTARCGYCKVLVEPESGECPLCGRPVAPPVREAAPPAATTAADEPPGKDETAPAPPPEKPPAAAEPEEAEDGPAETEGTEDAPGAGQEAGPAEGGPWPAGPQPESPSLKSVSWEMESGSQASQGPAEAPAEVRSTRIEPSIYPENPFDTLDDLIRLAIKWPRIIAQIGVSSSGKSFSVNKLRHAAHVGGNGRWLVDCNHCQKIPSTRREYMAATVITERRSNRRYQVIDCAGEDVSDGINKFSAWNKDPEAILDLEDRFQGLLAYARAYFIFIDSTAFEDGAGNTLIMINFFRRLCALIRVLEQRYAAADHLNALALKAVAQTRVTIGELEKALTDAQDLSRRPIYVIFSKADRLLERRGSGNPDADPVRFLQKNEHGRGLYNDIRKKFRHYHFDFATSFLGHTDEDGETPDYSRPDHGIIEAFEWVAGTLAANEARAEARNRQRPEEDGLLGTAGRMAYDIRRFFGKRSPEPCGKAVKRLRRTVDALAVRRR